MHMSPHVLIATFLSYLTGCECNIGCLKCLTFSTEGWVLCRLAFSVLKFWLRMFYEASSQLHLIKDLTLVGVTSFACLSSYSVFVSVWLCVCVCVPDRMHLPACTRILWIQLSHWSLWLMHTRHSDSRKVHWNRLCLSPQLLCVCASVCGVRFPVFDHS